MNALRRLARRCRLVALLCALGGGHAHAGWISFEAVMNGTSDIVAVVDPAVPIVRVQTEASGIGSLGLIGYRSADLVNLASGEGAGANTFVDDDGNELFGLFSVQLVPTQEAGLVLLFGDMTFTGGTGPFAGASGSAGFTGQGRFLSATHALSSFHFSGRLQTVDAPATVLLLPGAIGMLLAQKRRRRGLAPGASGGAVS